MQIDFKFNIGDTVVIDPRGVHYEILCAQYDGMNIKYICKNKEQEQATLVSLLEYGLRRVLTPEQVQANIGKAVYNFLKLPHPTNSNECLSIAINDAMEHLTQDGFPFAAGILQVVQRCLEEKYTSLSS